MAFCLIGRAFLIQEESITRLMDDGNTADVVNLNFAKAFHSALISKTTVIWHVLKKSSDGSDPI